MQKLQEETRLAQYAMQKFKTELSIMETSVMVKYQMAYEDMTREERWVTGPSNWLTLVKVEYQMTSLGQGPTSNS